ncbi:hypothetical protein ULVI_09320 [Cochleicola gelatinilyticus]|uniref:Mor transcription activator domain-containing protein n=1 Tax=Cochleicola gelatinilyticus TaxID=1763537 RepID=A0A167HMI2_9FLAO|nr:hypothetical protein ULVI_09320 [Cochleicola gelatinilyticus]
MTKYELINNQLTNLVKLIRNNIKADSTTIQHLMIYERFYKLEGSKQQRYEQLAKEYKLSSKWISQIILRLNKNAK